MGYAEDSQRYRDIQWRAKADMCVREQGIIFSNDGRVDIASLGRGVVAGNIEDIDAVLMATITDPQNDNKNLDIDSELLAGVQACWPSVASARYPQGG